MRQKKELEALNKQKLKKIDAYLKTKKNITPKHQKKLDTAKSKWQAAWAKYMDVIMYLETVEI